MRRLSMIRTMVIGSLLFGAAALTVKADPAFDKLIADGKYKEALDYADDKIPVGQRDAGTWTQLAKANDALGMPEKALACYLVSWRMNPENYQSMYGAAKVYNTLNQPDNAMNMAKKALDKSFTAEASWEYAKACIAQSKPAEAKSALEKVIESDPNNQIANKELGNIYFNDGVWQKALPLLKKTYAIKADPELSYKIGKSFVGAGTQPDSAIFFLKEAIGKPGVPPSAGLELARAYYGQGNFAAAGQQYQKCSEGMAAIDYYKEAVSLDKSNSQAAATGAFEKAVSLFGADRGAEALISRNKTALGMMARKAYNLALGHFQFIAEADPKGAVVPEIYFSLADAYQGIDNGPQAISSLEKAIALNKKNVEAYARLADLYAKNGMPDKAKQTFETMMSLSPNDPAIYLALGQYNLKAKKYADAFPQFEKSNSLQKSAAAAEGMAIAAFSLNRLDAARDAAESAVGLDANAWEARVILAKVLLQEKNSKAAQPHLEVMVKKEPARLDFKQQLASCYELNGEKEKLQELDKQIVAQSSTDVDSRLRLARNADFRNDIEGAFTLYRDLSYLQPKNADVLYRLYELSVKKNNFADAATFIGKFLEVKQTAEAERDYGDALYQLKDYDKALNAYRAALKLNPAIKGFHKRYAEIVIAKGQQDEVITALTGVVNSGEADVGTYQTIGLMYQKKNNYPKAIEMYQKALQLDPQNNEALSSLAQCQAASGALNDAIISYEQVVMMDTAASTEVRELGDIYFKQNNMAAAVKNYKRYLTKSPNDQAIAKRVGKYAYESQDWESTAKYLAAMQCRTDEDADYGMMYANACLSTKKNKEAIRVLETLRAMKAKGATGRSVLKTLADAYEKDGQEAQAGECYGAYCALPGVVDPDAAYKNAFLLEKSNPVAAEKVYESNIKKYQEDYRNFLRLGLLLSSKKETLAKAATYLKRTTTLAESVPTVWLELGKVYGKIGDEQEELAAYRKYLQSDPQNAEANKRAGIILAKKGQLSEALIFLEIANTLSPNDPDIMASLATGYVTTNRKNEAVDLLKKVKAVRPNDADVRFQLYDLYQKTGQKDKAKDEIKELATMKRDNKYLQKYAQSCIELGDLKSAETTIEDILATQADNVDVLMLKAKLQVLNKDYDKAVDTYKEISFIDQNHAMSMAERANVYLLQSKPQWAETFFQRALKADPKCAIAELGLARVAKLRKDQSGYQDHLDKAKALDPFNDQIQEEIKKGYAGK
jgi:tetratricopeptide (TPR) repeat protein